TPRCPSRAPRARSSRTGSRGRGTAPRPRSPATMRRARGRTPDSPSRNLLTHRLAPTDRHPRRRRPTRGRAAASRVRRQRAVRREVLRLPEARRDVWVGLLALRGAAGVVTPYRDDAEWAVAIAPGDLGGAGEGDVVVVEPLRAGRAPRGRVV